MNETSKSGKSRRSGISLKAQIISLTAARLVPGISGRMVYPFLAVFAAGLGVGLPVISIAVSSRAFIGIFSPVLTAMIEQYGRKPGVLLGLGLIVTGSGLVVLWPGYTTFFLFLCLGYIGSSIFVTCQQAFIGDRIPYIERGRVIGLVETSWAISYIIGMPLVAFLISRWGWIAPFPFIALLGVVFMAVVIRIMPAENIRFTMPKMRSTWQMLSGVLVHSSARYTLLFIACVITANECVGLVFGVWIADTLGASGDGFLNLQVAALGAASVLIGFAELAGELISGNIADRFGKERSIRVGIMINCLVVLLLPWLGSSLWGAYFGLFLFYLTFEFSVVAGIAVITEVLPALRVTMLGLTVGAAAGGRMVGALLASNLYLIGFQWNTLAVVILNVACLFALSRMKLSE